MTATSPIPMSLPVSARPDVTERLAQRSIVEAASLAHHHALCLATGAALPCVARDVAALAHAEFSVSAAALPLPDDSRLGSFTESEGTFGDARRLAAAIYGADEARLLVGGSTMGNQVIAKVLGARSATTLVAGNAHQSAWYSLIDAHVGFVRLNLEFDEFGAVHVPTPASIRDALRREPCQAVHITSPTYEGATADIRGIAEVVHEAGAILIVDSAWGASAPFHSALPEFPTELGADVAITSTHKTVGAPQQTALLLIRGARISGDEIDWALDRTQTTSPSPTLLGGIDSALRAMVRDGESLIGRTIIMAADLEQRLLAIPGAGTELYRAPRAAGRDATRVTVRFGGREASGFEIATALAERSIMVEKASSEAVTLHMAMTLPDDAPARLASAIEAALAELPLRKRPLETSATRPSEDVERAVLTPGVAERIGHSWGEFVDMEHAAGRIACEVFKLYPPGVPVVLPGFVVTPEAAELLQAARRNGATITGSRSFDGRIRVLRPGAIPTGLDDPRSETC